MSNRAKVQVRNEQAEGHHPRLRELLESSQSPDGPIQEDEGNTLDDLYKCEIEKTTAKSGSKPDLDDYDEWPSLNK
jgi:hypothetical protein